MVYLDTSFIAPLVITEPSSGTVESVVLKIRAGAMATGKWTEVEVASLIARKVRMKQLTARDADAIRVKFAEVLQVHFHVLLPTAADYESATHYLQIPNTGLRAADAFHLAIAANRSARKILSLDAGFIKAGKMFNLPVGVR
jgi:uncharacterized protein